MSEQEQIQECLRKEIRSLLISTKDGLTPQQLEKEYLSMVGNHLPLRVLGYGSTMELILDMPDVVSVCRSGEGAVILKAIPDESTRGIASLVAKQRSNHKVRNSVPKGRTSVCPGPSSRAQIPYRGRVPPILPAVVKSELKDLLALSPVLLSDFEKAFAKRFGRSFQYVQYGFLSMFEVLNAASDVISVEQTRAGSLLTLKKSGAEEKQGVWPTGTNFTQPFRAKQGSFSAGAPISRVHFSQPMPNMELPKPVLHVEKASRSHATETARLNHTEKLNQLENTFKSVIAQLGPGGTINPDIKEKIKFVVSKSPGGLLISRLLGEFEEIFKEQLSPKKLGFLNVTELVGALSDVLRVEFREGEQDLVVFCADRNSLPPDGAVSSVRNSYLVQPDKKIEVKANPSRNALSIATVKETAWNSPSKNLKEPEQKIYKKPNLMVKPLQLQAGINKPQLNLAVGNHDIPPDAVRDKKLCRPPPLDTSTLVGVFVEYIISPSQFYIRIYSRDSSELLEDMMIEMRRCYSNQLVSDRYVMPEYFIQTNARLVSCCYTKLPAQAIPCSLAWVRPTEEYWTPKAVLQFQKLCGLKPLVGVVDEYIDGILNLFLCDTSSNEDVYFHHVLRTEGYAIVCRENVPSKGFRELNPLALYTESSPGSEDVVLAELNCPSQPHYFNEDREISPPSKESEPYSLDEIPTGMPCLESVTIGDDIWDENWEMGKGSSAASNLFASSMGGKKQYPSSKDISQKQPTLKESLDSSTLPKSLEQLYISLIHSQQSTEGGIQNQPKQTQIPTAPSSTATVVDSPEKHSGSVGSSPGSLENEDFASSHAITLFNDRSQGTMDQISLILSSENQISQKFYIPRSTATAALGAAARLATSRSFLHWYPSMKRMEA
ncbi:tudor domain-containing protein 5 [Echinops telfairi]|uniref:Tudor domain-containing protein 5 n=1 Tax=Echinops telfairi TaxID=9371 RepID=A0AC55DQA1_ECHTE|nr:tudor domain-containing protein 5 [Echinops telfairi]